MQSVLKSVERTYQVVSPYDDFEIGDIIINRFVIKEDSGRITESKYVKLDEGAEIEFEPPAELLLFFSRLVTETIIE